MNVAILAYFQPTARCGNITSAAKAVGLQQPSLSVALRRLEDEFGTTLLRRERDGVTLTSTSQEYLHSMTEVLSGAAEGHRLPEERPWLDPKTYHSERSNQNWYCHEPCILQWREAGHRHVLVGKPTSHPAL